MNIVSEKPGARTGLNRIECYVEAGESAYLSLATYWRPGVVNMGFSAQSDPAAGTVTLYGTLAPPERATDPDTAIQASIPWTAIPSGALSPSGMVSVVAGYYTAIKFVSAAGATKCITLAQL